MYGSILKPKPELFFYTVGFHQSTVEKSYSASTPYFKAFYVNKVFYPFFSCGRIQQSPTNAHAQVKNGLISLVPCY